MLSAFAYLSKEVKRVVVCGRISYQFNYGRYVLRVRNSSYCQSFLVLLLRFRAQPLIGTVVRANGSIDDDLPIGPHGGSTSPLPTQGTGQQSDQL